MLFRFFLLFTIFPLIELALLIWIGTHIGVLSTIGIILVTGFFGAFIARQQGFQVWTNIQNQMNSGIFPANELIEGLLLLIAGAVLITPGIITDVLGFVILLPASRYGVREFVKKRFRRMMDSGNVRASGFFY